QDPQTRKALDTSDQAHYGSVFFNATILNVYFFSKKWHFCHPQSLCSRLPEPHGDQDHLQQHITWCSRSSVSTTQSALDAR
ncbi:MAG: hypothetical protein AAGJ35_03005, partial [Myxococcota bacterium]